MGCDFINNLGVIQCFLFQSTQPEWAATEKKTSFFSIAYNFNPRSPSGLRLPVYEKEILDLTISIHAARVGCDVTPPSGTDAVVDISIHAARVGCDRLAIMQLACHWYISIHAARVGCDLLICSSAASAKLFQSTQPEWAATR